MLIHLLLFCAVVATHRNAILHFEPWLYSLYSNCIPPDAHYCIAGYTGYSSAIHAVYSKLGHLRKQVLGHSAQDSLNKKLF